MKIGNLDRYTHFRDLTQCYLLHCVLKTLVVMFSYELENLRPLGNLQT